MAFLVHNQKSLAPITLNPNSSESKTLSKVTRSSDAALIKPLGAAATASVYTIIDVEDLRQPMQEITNQLMKLIQKEPAKESTPATTHAIAFPTMPEPAAHLH